MRVSGAVAPGFEPVRIAFEHCLAEHRDRGAAFAVCRGDETLVDLWGGQSASGVPWTSDTLTVVFSGTKSIVGAVMAILGETIAPEHPVARFWPKFASAGKDRMTVGEALSHRARLPGLRAALVRTDLLDDVEMEALVAAEQPFDDNRAVHCYHPLTIGWIAGGLVRAATGESVGRVFAERIAKPLGIEVFLGVPPHAAGRVGDIALSAGWCAADAKLSQLASHDPLARAVWANPPVFGPSAFAWNDGAIHAAQVPGAGAVATALGMARLHAWLAGGAFAGAPPLPSVAGARRRQVRFMDPFLVETMAFGTLFRLQNHRRPLGPPPEAFGHTGAGGSIHAAWPSEGVGLSFITGELCVDRSALEKLLVETHAALRRGCVSKG